VFEVFLVDKHECKQTQATAILGDSSNIGMGLYVYGADATYASTSLHDCKLAQAVAIVGDSSHIGMGW